MLNSGSQQRLNVPVLLIRTVGVLATVFLLLFSAAGCGKQSAQEEKPTPENPRAEAYKVAQDFVAFQNTRDYDSQYELITPEYRKTVSKEDYATAARYYDSQYNYTYELLSGRQGAKGTTDTRYGAKVQVLEDGKEFGDPIMFLFDLTDGNWYYVPPGSKDEFAQFVEKGVSLASSSGAASATQSASSSSPASASLSTSDLLGTWTATCDGYVGVFGEASTIEFLEDQAIVDNGDRLIDYSFIDSSRIEAEYAGKGNASVYTLSKPSNDELRIDYSGTPGDGYCILR